MSVTTAIMNAAVTFAIAFFVILGCISGIDIYPSIHWFPHNPVFQADGINCGPGPRELKVQLQAKIIFVCPNSATVLQTSSSEVQETVMFENLWLLENKTAFDECDVLLDPKKRRLLTCDTPSKLTYSSVTFAQYTAEHDGLTFDGGQTYYFVATSDGRQSHVNSTSGGNCVNNNMKIEVYVCKRSNETYQDPECQTGVGKLMCPVATSGTPTPSTMTATVSSITTPSAEGISATRSIQASTSEQFCVQTVITKTVSSEVTASVSCPNVCEKSASSIVMFTDACEQCISRSTQPSPSSMTPTEGNETQQVREEGLSSSEDDCSGKETWQAVAALFIVLFCVVTIIAVVTAIKYRKSCFRSSCQRVAPLEENSGTEMKTSEKP